MDQKENCLQTWQGGAEQEPAAPGTSPTTPAGQSLCRPRKQLLVEDKSATDRLSRIVRTLVADETLREDLLQEGLLHLWVMEQHRPGQTRSWYIHSCRFHLQHCLAAGRSVDSPKRGSLEVDQALEEEGFTGPPDPPDGAAGLLEQVCANELICLLCAQLKPRGRAVLACLAEGMGSRETARKLCLSHPTVSKYRLDIARLVLELGIPRPRNGYHHHRNGHNGSGH